jgi:putative MATE family efflux protein
MKNDSQKSKSMGVDPIWSLLFRFSGPAIISMTVAASYNLVDAIFIGQLGPEALAAITVAFPITLVFNAICSGTGIGAASLISRYLGAGEQEKADQVACLTISLSFLVSILVIISFLPLLDIILTVFGAEQTVLPLATSYLKVLIFGSLISFFPSIVSSIIRAEGSPFVASSALILSSLVNIILDPFLIFGWGVFPEMGIAGASTATIIAQGCGAILFLKYFLSAKTTYQFRLSFFWPQFKIILAIYRVGISSIVRSAGTFLVLGIANRTIATFGVTPLALLGVFLRLFRFALMPCLGVGQGLIPLVGFNFGAGNKKRVGEVVLKAGLSGFGWSGFCWLIVMLFPRQVISIFNNDPEFLNEGVRAVRIFAMIFFTLGIQLIPGFFFQAIGKGFPATIISSARYVLFLLPCLFILPSFLGIYGVWISFPLADALSFSLASVWMMLELKKNKIPLSLRFL